MDVSGRSQREKTKEAKDELLVRLETTIIVRKRQERDFYHAVVQQLALWLHSKKEHTQAL